MSNALNITITEAAQKRMETLAGGEALRLDIKATGCSGHSYVLAKAAMPEASDDVVEAGVVRLAIPKTKSWMLIGMTIDYRETDFAQEFVFTNPNEKGRCGCGESFAV